MSSGVYQSVIMHYDRAWTTVVGTRRGAALAVGALSYPALALAEAGVATALDLPGLVWVEPAALLTLPLALLFGRAALLPAGAGVLLAAAAAGSLGVGTAVTLAATLYLGFAAAALAERLGVRDKNEDAGAFAWTPARYLLVVGLAGAGATAVAAWAAVLVGEAVFFVAAPAALVAYAAIPAVTTLPLTALGRRLPIPAATGSGSRAAVGGVRRVAGTTTAWLLLGTVGSLGYRSFEVLPAETMRLYGLGVLVPLHEAVPFAPGATRLQVLLGVVSLVVLVALLRDGSADGGVESESAEVTR